MWSKCGEEGSGDCVAGGHNLLMAGPRDPASR